MNYLGIINSFIYKKILVIGDLILDRYILGKVTRISPEAPVPVVDVVEENFRMGGAANVANNIRALGGKVTIAGTIGNDSAGNKLVEMLTTSNINIEGLITDRRHTTVKTRVIAHNQQVVRFDKEERKKVEGKNLENLLNFLKESIPQHDAIIISDYKKGVISSPLMDEVVLLANRYHKFISVDPKVGHFHLYKNVSLLTPNVVEASEGSGVEIKDEKSLIKAGKILVEKLRCHSLLITRGEEGMTLFKKSNGFPALSVTHFPTVARKVFDVTGAGDTVIATFTLAYSAGATMEEAAKLSNHAAGIVVAEVGTAVPQIEKLLKSLELCK
ncbi:MAG: D-glycero-beta-D-manno-heptose-7-phosphate kinase [Thermodesulfovibrionales bacterium]|nr:D-glycero-beta-D-manno-heptose-7-phosphate kinase [Thermodesulfovibrionales bacterium]